MISLIEIFISWQFLAKVLVFLIYYGVKEQVAHAKTMQPGNSPQPV
jgi:hypothetical protein